MTRVSVVTPFYNTAPYLAECIDSVLAQSHGDFEYILCNNHSTDGSDQIAARHAARDRRLRVVSPPAFLDQVPNYNFALRQIAPDASYVKIVQADDTIFPRCLTEMIALAEAHPSIGVVSAYRMFGAEVQPPTGLPHTRTFLTGRDACRTVLADGIYLFGSPTTVMFRADLVRGRAPFYAEGRLFEDAEVCFELLAGCDFGFVHQVLSFTRTENDSLWRGMRGYNGWLLARRNQLAQFGRQYLAPDEFDRLWRTRERHYRSFLAEAWLARRDAGFWKFHAQGLATVGDAIDRKALIRDAARVALGYAVSPRRLAALLRERARPRTP
ncbi:MAG TPA: glycosyltransferase family 2 protein [Kofleriaceae bacterium]|jgi:glycosyltransferase involved in cell wall biosynthesis|nr:glycosyltransferase family 2 protein [Kofleriaceae bacterium]